MVWYVVRLLLWIAGFVADLDRFRVRTFYTWPRTVLSNRLKLRCLLLDPEISLGDICRGALDCDHIDWSLINGCK